MIRLQLRGGTREEREEFLDVLLQTRHRTGYRCPPAARPPTEDLDGGALGGRLIEDRLRFRVADTQPLSLPLRGDAVGAEGQALPPARRRLYRQGDPAQQEIAVPILQRAPVEAPDLGVERVRDPRDCTHADGLLQEQVGQWADPPGATPLINAVHRSRLSCG